jgi:hypothetical protein
MPERVLSGIPSSVVEELWTEVLVERVRRETERALDGQRLRIQDLPRSVLERFASRAATEVDHGVEIYVVDLASGPEPWRVGAHRVVQRRDSPDARVVVAAIPPDVKLAAGDSLDVSTFRLLATEELGDAVFHELFAKIPSALHPGIQRTLDYLDQKGWELPDTARLEFLASVAVQDTADESVVGGSLYTLGLIPDFELLSSDGDPTQRLGLRNIPAVARLREHAGTTVERVVGLPLSETPEGVDFTKRLISLDGIAPLYDIRHWGELVATDASWRNLALEHWPFADELPPPGAIRIDILPLPLPRRDDGIMVLESTASVRVSWQTNPAPLDVPGLEYFRVELVSSDGVVAWETALIRRGTGRTARRSRTVSDLSDVEPGVYFFRVVALNIAGDELADQEPRDPDRPDGKRTNESDDFLLVGDVGEDEGGITPAASTTVASYAEAELRARWMAKSAKLPEAKREWLTAVSSKGQVASASIRFDTQRSYVVNVGQRLRLVEESILRAPSDGGSRRFALTDHLPEAEAQDLNVPEAVRAARESVLTQIRDMSNEGDGVTTVLLADLASLALDIEAYAAAYLDWLEAEDSEALLMDIVKVDLGSQGAAVLVAPTHPLRLLWLLQEQQIARAWVDEAALRTPPPSDVVETWRSALAPTGIPSLVVLGASEAYVDAGPLPGGWGLYLPLRARDSRALLALLHSRLGTARMHAVEADIPPRLLADKFELLLRQHPYTPALTINVVNPGDAALIVDAVLDLEDRRKSDPLIRYELRLFTDHDVPEVGSALRELADPERQVSDVASQLMAPGRSFLFPRLSWSLRPLRDFVERPEDYVAHATLILDAFQLGVRVARRDGRERSSYVHGLVQEAPRRFVGRGGAYSWVRRPAPTPCLELDGAPGRSGLVARLLTAIGSLEASVIAPGSDTTGSVAAPVLDLRPSDQSLLFSAHTVSTWVLTVDPYLGLDYFDARGSSDRRGYLLDFTPEFVAAGGRQLLLTTRASEEIDRLMAPAVGELELTHDPRAAELLVEALRSLSGRLALRLLSSPTQVQGALGMALSRLVLEAYGLLEQAVVIPLDAHPELTRESPTTPNLRGDLLVVTADPESRALDFLIVESKCMRGEGLSSALRTEIVGQVRSSEMALRGAFDPDLATPDRIDRVIQSWRLSTVLDFYLDRALRYGTVKHDVVEALRIFVQDLESGYQLSVRKMGLVFRLDSETTPDEPDREEPDVPIWVVGRDVFGRVAREALESFEASAATDLVEAAPVSGRSTLRDHPTWERVRRTVAHWLSPTVGIADSGTTRPEPPPQQPKEAVEPTEGPTRDDEEAPLPDTGGVERVEPEVFVGAARATQQYSVLAAPTGDPARRIALDLDGCNTLSLFGVQGSGKSYTLGTVIESAVMAIPGLNELPRPLASVVFHFHQTQDYPPEFVAMESPNDDAGELRDLAAWGAEPAGVDDVLLLTTADTVDYRRTEFPGVTVEPIAFASSELTVQDWRFLMGAVGSDSFYLQLLNDVMRRARDKLTLDAIRAGINASPMSATQQALASTRIDFAARFIDDSRSLRSLMRPGRVVIVDVRDEFIEKEQALGLFVTMLNVFAGAGMGATHFNKLIVFDEAHKYMGGGPLINHVVEVIREMRHKGVSVVVASQDPVNVPPPVIELSSIVALHRFNSPNWLKHIQRSVAALGELTPQMMQALGPGEAFLWAGRSTDPVISRRPVRVRIRPRVSKHGGSTRRATSVAVDDSTDSPSD